MPMALNLVCRRAVLAALGCLPGLLLAAPPAQDPSPLVHLQRQVPEAERTQVLVLGTFHFREIKAQFQPALVEPLLRQLEAFKPDVVAVEALPGACIHELELRAKATSIHEEVLGQFAKTPLDLGHEAQALLKLDMIQASRALAGSKAMPADPMALASRTLHCLAAYEWPSALLAWSLVPPGHPARTQVPASLASKLDAELSRINEIQTVAIPLARKLGHPSIACVDEFEDLETLEPVMEALQASRKDSPLLGAVGKAQVYRDSRDRRDAALAAGDLLPYFRHLNSPAYMAADVDAQWGVFLGTHLKDGSDRGRLALWENRNLKIAARIRALSARHPGQRILVIYGAAHKPFLEAYLGAGSDLRLVQPEAVLNPVTPAGR